MREYGVQSSVFSPIALPCGRTLQNRLVKVAMYEHLAALFGGPPNENHFSLYANWAKFGWGMVITGNVQVSSTHLTLGRDITLPNYISGDSLEPFRKLASSIIGTPQSRSNSLAIMQLSHAGRQSPNLLGGRYAFQRPSGPSPVPIRPKGQGIISDLLHMVAFQSPYEMSEEEIADTVAAFVRGARVAVRSGFDGVQLHAAHGYLLAQFMSPKSNKRGDDYSIKNALRLLHQVVVAIRAVVPRNFILGIKVNAADYVTTDDDGSFNHNHNPTSHDALHDIRAIASWCLIDFIEISGGDYEKPEFMNIRRSPRQTLFSKYSHQAVHTLSSPTHPVIESPPLILLTGGLRTPELLYTALSSRHAHLLGIGRGSVLCPHLPMLLKRQEEGEGEGKQMQDIPGWGVPFSPEPDLELAWSGITWIPQRLPRIPLLGAGVNMAWYIVEMRRFAEVSMTSKESASGLPEIGKYGFHYHSPGPVGAIFWMWAWFDEVTLHRIRVLAVWSLMFFWNWLLCR